MPLSKQQEFEFRARLEAELEAEQAQQAPSSEALQSEGPSMGAVALNAIPKGIANFLNTPNTINQLVLKGVGAIPGMPQAINDLAEDPRLTRNGPMEFAKRVGLVKPENDPQTPIQRLVDSGIQAAVGSAVVPGSGLANAAKQAVLGGTSGVVGQGVKEFTDSPVLGGIASLLTPVAIGAAVNSIAQVGKKILLNDTAKMTLKDAQKVGFVVEPSQVRQPSSKLETIAGKASIAQSAVEKNQTIANQLAAKALNLPPETPLSPSLIQSLKQQAMQPYREVDVVFQQLKQANALPYFPRYHSASLMDEYTEASQNARALWKSYSRDPKIDILKAAKAADTHAEGVFKDIERVAQASGDPKLAQRVLGAKKSYAIINDVETAMNVGSGNVSMPTLASMLDKGKPLSGELKIIAKFANAFPRVAREVERTPPSGVSGTDAASAAVLGSLGAAMSGSPTGLAMAGLPLLRGPARNRLLSEAYQSKLLQEPASRFGGLSIPPGVALKASGMGLKTMYDKREEE